MRLFSLTSLKASSLLLTLVFATTAYSAPGTKTSDDMPVEITADRLLAQEQAGESLYIGSVNITQGSTVIQGDKVKLFHPKQVFSNAIINGQPATFKRFIVEDQQWVQGQANKITYDATQKTLLFEGNARVDQEGKNSISGERIFYDLTKKTLSANGNKAEQKRIKVIFAPEANGASKTPKKTAP